MNNIQRIFLNLFLLLVCSSPVLTQGALAQIGFAFGANSSRLTEVDDFTSFEDASGWHIEIWFDMPLGLLELRPALRYVSAGSVFEVANDADPNFRDDVNVSLFEVPIDFRFRFNMEVLTPYVTVGPVLRFPSGGGDEIEGMQSASVAGGFGVGLQFAVNTIVLYPEIKYTFGITSFTDDELQIAQRTYRPDSNQLLNGFMIRLSVGI